MPQVDLETLVCGGDRKIACETAAAERPEDLPDYAAESFYVAKEDEFDWFDRNAVFERKESTKGNSNGVSTYNPNSTPSLSSVSNSQRFPTNYKSKASLIGFPKAQNTSYADCKQRRHCRASNPTFFPKRSRSTGKSALPLTEPTSPKVSCIGRVRSKRQRSRRQRSLRQAEPPIHPPPHPPQPTQSVGKSEKHGGFWTSFKAVLRFGRRRKTPRGGGGDDSAESSPQRMSVKSEKVHSRIAVSEPDGEPPGLGAMKRFASGRRSECSWGEGDEGGDADLEEGSQIDSLWRRRGVGPLVEVDGGRGWESVGPATV
ncbi:hypothetical protein Scep_003336 [Stephania cephalantha]|uniref:Uncharacterized protein n=1 Tax=Stephania cephalantha TaxID=152367 RepID=A0AAP0KQA6_9MAGN